MGVIARKPKLVHPLLGYICGMCSDELPYGQIADKVLEAKGYAHDLEAQLAGAVDALRELADAAKSWLEPEGSGEHVRRCARSGAVGGVRDGPGWRGVGSRARVRAGGGTGRGERG
jgi:hypothetical protein